MKQHLVLTFLLFISFLWNRSCQTLSLDSMTAQAGIQPSIFEGGLDDLEAFQAWAEGIKTDMSKANPSLYEVLGEIVSSKQPIEEGDILQTSQNMIEKQRTLRRVLQAKTEKNKLHRRRGFKRLISLSLLMKRSQQKQTIFR